MDQCPQEVSTLARCQSENITQYYASVLKPGTSELLIVMELMDASVADLVGQYLLHQAACPLLYFFFRGPAQDQLQVCPAGAMA